MKPIIFRKDIPNNLFKRLRNQEGQVLEVRRLAQLDMNRCPKQADRLRDYYIRRDAYINNQLAKIIETRNPAALAA